MGGSGSKVRGEGGGGGEGWGEKDVVGYFGVDTLNSGF